MNLKELAKHWNVSQGEAERISEYVNSRYSAGIVSKTEDFCDGWKVLLYAYDHQNKYILMEDEGSFPDKHQAIIHGTRWAQNIKMTPGQAKIMGVPEDAFLALKPIEGFEKAWEEYKKPAKVISHKPPKKRTQKNYQKV